MSIKLTINSKEYEVPEGLNVLRACEHVGINVPHFCYHPGLGPDGNCRMCQVEYVSDRGNRLGISCNAVVTEGMEVLTNSEKVKRARASVEEMLLLNHPLDCPICDKAGECTLQDYYMAHDLQDGRQDFERYRKAKAEVIGPTLVLDQQRCVLCDRCVRFLRDVAGDEQLYIAGRGHGAYITTFPGEEVTSPYSLNTVDLCPVGALTSRDFRFGSATWFLKSTGSVCTSCARGCAMEIQSKDNKIYRMRPRHNPEVNGYWMCDEGRLNYKFVNEKRITRPSRNINGDQQTLSSEEAISEFRVALGYPPAGVADIDPEVKSVVLTSASCTLEEMYQAKRLAKDFLNSDAFVVRHVPDGVDDHLLRRADRHSNVKGAQLLSLDVLDFVGEGGIGAAQAVEDSLGEGGALVCVGFNYEIPPALQDLVAKAGKVVSISGCENALNDKAHLVIPGFTFAEKYGLVVNFEGHVQKLWVALDYAADFAPTAQLVRNQPAPVSDWRVLEDLMTSLSGGEGANCVATIRKAISQNEASFAGVDLNKIGDYGLRLSGQPVG